MSNILSGITITLLIGIFNKYNLINNASKFELLFYTNDKKIIYNIIMFVKICLILFFLSIFLYNIVVPEIFLEFFSVIYIILLINTYVSIHLAQNSKESRRKSNYLAFVYSVKYYLTLYIAVLVINIIWCKMASEQLKDVNEFVSCAILSIFNATVIYQYLIVYKNKIINNRFYFVCDNIKYYIHYAESKEHVICSTEKSLYNASKVKYFKIEDIKNGYEIICENNLEPEETAP